MPRGQENGTLSKQMDARVLFEINRHRDGVECWLRQVMGASQEEAEDAVAEAVLRLWTKRGVLRTSESQAIRKWLRQTARRELYHLYARRAGVINKPIEDFAESLISPMPTPADAAERHEALALWTAALNRLPLADRALLRRWQAGESPTEIANELGVPSSRVRLLIHRRYAKSIEIARKLAASSTYTWCYLDPRRVERIAEIAGVSARIVRWDAVEYDWGNQEEHQHWLDTALDQEIADWVAGNVDQYDVVD
jgi:RNA polymerase sigma-70 factor, ECF subfamily